MANLAEKLFESRLARVERMPEIDRERVRRLARRGLAVRAIAALTACPEASLRRRCEEELAMGRAQFELDLRNCQYKSAKALNATMLKWLGQVELGQVEPGRNQKADERGEPEPELDAKVG